MGWQDDDEDEDDEATALGNIDELLSSAQGHDERQQACVIVIAGPTLGAMFPINTALVVGRKGDADIPLHDNEVSRRHARLWFDEAGGVVVEDLNSTNGTFVDGEPVRRRRLGDGDKIVIGKTSILKFSYQDSVESEFQQQMYNSAVRDAQTKTYNKRHFMEQLRKEFSFAKRHGGPLALVMLDIDFFKHTNDEYGHLAGDHVLSVVARNLTGHLRQEDTLARYGGEEFAIICRGTAFDEAMRLGERLRTLVEGLRIEYEKQKIPVTISVGVAALPSPHVPDETSLVEHADQALYTAKNNGRNRVEGYPTER